MIGDAAAATTSAIQTKTMAEWRYITAALHECSALECLWCFEAACCSSNSARRLALTRQVYYKVIEKPRQLGCIYVVVFSSLGLIWDQTLDPSVRTSSVKFPLSSEPPTYAPAPVCSYSYSYTCLQFPLNRNPHRFTRHQSSRTFVLEVGLPQVLQHQGGIQRVQM